MEKPIVNEEQVIDAPPPAEEVTEAAPQPGEKTDSALLLKSLQEERDKRREEERMRKELEAELERLSNPQPEVFSDEGAALKRELDHIKDELAVKEVREKFPALKDKAEEFEEFRNSPENKGMSIATAAKAFLVEKDLITSPEPRKGLEPVNGGGREAPRKGRTEEEIADLRVNNWPQYVRELKAGKLRS